MRTGRFGVFAWIHSYFTRLIPDGSGVFVSLITPHLTRVQTYSYTQWG